MDIIGRTKEIRELQEIYKLESSAFAAVYGRRRVGKTFLIRKVLENQLDFYCTGVANSNLSMQLGVFNVALCQYGHSKVPQITPTNWMEAFQNLIRLLEKSPKKRKVIF